jgi:hypothetical protein
MFIGERSLASERQVRSELADALNGKPAPALIAKRWFNVPQLPKPARTLIERETDQSGKSLAAEGTSLAPTNELKNEPLLLYFWTGSAYEPWAARLHDKYKDRGLGVVSIHYAYNAYDLEATIKDRDIRLPIALDIPERTERAYSVKIWPTYFLIDKDGKVRQGYLEHAPTDKQIEELLK